MKHEINDFKHLYAESVLQIFRDLERPPVVVEYIDKHSGQRRLSPWYVYFGEKLETFRQYIDRHKAAPWISVPDFPRAVHLWTCDELTEYNIQFGARANIQQRAINNVLQSKLDSVFIDGDPFLTAQSVRHSEQHVRLMLHLAGLSISKTDDAVAKMLALAENLNLELDGHMAAVYRPHKNLLLQLDLSEFVARATAET